MTAAPNTLETIADLVPWLGRLLDADDPVAALRKGGCTLAPALAQQLAGRLPVQPFTAAQRQAFRAMIPPGATVQFAVEAPAPRAKAPTLPPGDYDFIVAMRMQLVSDVLAALYAGYTWPRTIAASDASALFPIDALRAFSAAVPSDPSVSVGALHLSAAATASASAQTPHVVLAQPFQLDLVRATAAGTEPVTTLVGTVAFGVGVTATVRDQALVLTIGGLQLTELATGDNPRVTVDSTSPMQPRGAGALDALDAALSTPFFVAQLVKEQSLQLAPSIALPLGGFGDVSLDVQRVDIVTRTDASTGVLIAGVLLGDHVDAGTGDPSTLANPLQEPAANVYARTAEALLQKIVAAAFASGALEKSLQATAPGKIALDGASLDLAPNQIDITVEGRMVDACAFGKDLGFTGTVSYVYAVYDGVIQVTKSTSIRLHAGDVVLCIVLGLLEVVLAAVVFEAAGLAIDLIAQIVKYVQLVPGGASGPPDFISAVFDPLTPVPGTEALPRLEMLQSIVEDHDLRGLGAATLRADDVNTYFYLAFEDERIVGGIPVPHSAGPLAGARVDVVDQDAPAPPNDDVVPPAPTHSMTNTGKTTTVIESSYVAPTSDQVIATGTTDDQGRLRLVVPPQHLVTTAGNVVTHSTVTIRGGGDPPTVNSSSNTASTPVIERKPDVYFRVTLADGAVVDTRAMRSGLLVNLADRRVGAPNAPLTFTVSG